MSTGFSVTLAKDSTYRRRLTPLHVNHTAPITQRFHPIAKLSKGGMGTVHLMEDTQQGHLPVAVKIPNGPGFDQGMEKEIRTQLALPPHENLANMIAFGYDPVERVHWFAMPYIEGELLAEVLKTGPLTLAESLKVVKAAASGLACAAAQGLIHKDLKPGNIMFGRHGEIKVIDFGLAHVQSEGCIAGTPGYLSPEQLYGTPELDLRSDIFALGIVFYQMLHGSHPAKIDVDAKSLLSVMAANKDMVDNGLPPVRYISVDEKVRSLTEEFVARLTANRREHRYQSYEEVIAAAEAIEARLAAYNAEIAAELASLDPGPLDPSQF